MEYSQIQKENYANEANALLAEISLNVRYELITME